MKRTYRTTFKSEFDAMKFTDAFGKSGFDVISYSCAPVSDHEWNLIIYYNDKNKEVEVENKDC